MIVSKEVKIWDYVAEHPDCTKTEVINHININSPIPTHKAIKRLVKEKKLISTPDKSNSSIHHLRINDKNTFNQINKELSGIGIMIGLMQKERVRLFEAQHSLRRRDTGEVDFDSYEIMYALECLQRGYEFPFKPVVDMVLYELLITTAKRIPIESDCHKLYAKIIELMKTLGLLYYEPSYDSIELLNSYLGTLNALRDGGSSLADMNTVSNFITTLEGFKQNFLTKSSYYDKIRDRAIRKSAS